MILISKNENYELPQGWSKCCLPDFTDIVMGQSPTSDTYNKSGNGIPFFQGKAEFGVIYPTVAKFCSAPNKIASAGATLLSVRAPVGPTNLAKEKCCIGRGLAAIHPVGGIAPMFVLYLLRSIETNISKEGTGSTFSAINKQFVEELEFGLPPLPEQHRIVAKIEELFSELDKGIENLKTAQAQLKVYRQALLKHAFEGKLTVQWREQHRDQLETAAALQQRIQQERAQRHQQQLADWEAGGKQGSKPKAPKLLPPLTADELAELPQLPEGWGWMRVEDACSHIVDCLHSTAKFQDKGFPCIDTTCIEGMRIIWEKVRFVDEPTFLERISRLKPIEGDILFAREGTVGTTVLVPKEVDLCLGQRMMMFRTASLIDARYFANCLMSPIFKSQYKPLIGGSTAQHLNIGDIKKLCIPICTNAEQQQLVDEIEERLSEIDQLELTLATSLQQAEALRQSILKRAFSGQLVPQDPHDEPASVLLARIKAEKMQPAEKPKKPVSRSKRNG